MRALGSAPLLTSEVDERTNRQKLIAINREDHHSRLVANVQLLPLLFVFLLLMPHSASSEPHACHAPRRCMTRSNNRENGMHVCCVMRDLHAGFDRMCSFAQEGCNDPSS